MQGELQAAASQLQQAEQRAAQLQSQLQVGSDPSLGILAAATAAGRRLACHSVSS